MLGRDKVSSCCTNPQARMFAHTWSIKTWRANTMTWFFIGNICSSFHYLMCIVINTIDRHDNEPYLCHSRQSGKYPKSKTDTQWVWREETKFFLLNARHSSTSEEMERLNAGIYLRERIKFIIEQYLWVQWMRQGTTPYSESQIDDTSLLRKLLSPLECVPSLKEWG